MTSKAGFNTDSEMTKEYFGAPSHDELQAGTTEKPSTVTGLKYWVKRLAVETGGIERVTDEDRAENTSKVWNACTFW